MTKRIFKKIDGPQVESKFDTCPDCQAKKVKGTDCNRSGCPGRKARRRAQ